MFSIRYWCFSLYPSNFLYAPCVWLAIPVALYLSAVMIGLLGGRQVPFAKVATVDNNVFSEERALIHLKAISNYVRVPGSLGSISARTYLLNQTQYYFNVSMMMG